MHYTTTSDRSQIHTDSVSQPSHSTQKEGPSGFQNSLSPSSAPCNPTSGIPVYIHSSRYFIYSIIIITASKCIVHHGKVLISLISPWQSTNISVSQICDNWMWVIWICFYLPQFATMFTQHRHFHVYLYIFYPSSNRVLLFSLKWMTWLSKQCLMHSNHLHQTTTFFHRFCHWSSPPTLLCQAYPGPPLTSRSPPNRPLFSTDYTYSRASDNHSQPLFHGLAYSSLDPYPTRSGCSSQAQSISSMSMLEELRMCEIDSEGGSEDCSPTHCQLSSSIGNMAIDILKASTANVTIPKGLGL